MSQNCVSFATPIFSKYNLTVFTYCYKLEQRFNTEDHGAITLYCIWTNLLQLHRPKNNHRKIIVIGQVIGSGQIDSFICIESIILSIHFPNFRKESMF